MDQVRDLVRDDRAAHEVGRLHQPPVDANAAAMLARARAAAPAALRARQPQVGTLEPGEGAVMAEIFADDSQGLGLEPAPEPGRDRLGRPAEAYLARRGH